MTVKRDRGPTLLDLPRGILRQVVSFAPSTCAPVCKELYAVALLERPSFCAARGLELGIRSELLLNSLFKCVNIRVLDVSGWERWNDRLLQRLTRCYQMDQFVRLRALLMRGCNDISNAAVSVLLTTLGASLSYLDLNDCNRLGAACLPAGLTNLKVLCLGYQRRRGKLDGKDIVAHITGAEQPIAPNLECLSLQHRVEAQSLVGIERLAPTLKVLDLRGCSEIPPEDYRCCKALTGLEQLFVGTALTSEVLSEIASACKKLRILDISGSDLSPNCVELVCNNLKSLEKLKLTRCKGLNNDGFQRLLSSLPKLSLLDVSHCWKLSDSLCNHMPQIASKGKIRLTKPFVLMPPQKT
ncbi:leucine rich repeat-containing, putative [Babesia ovis]|uniref:Leucine rich repeat-containing, putative n=1 Tax=Babesia ovis TaxID=5869 RepID=A0A9W5WUY6_BABOV|nr:leucine rich repeat-containing, putative [Babesia ovis]